VEGELMRAPRWFKTVAYPSWFLFCFVGSLYLTFPMHLVKEPIVTGLEGALGKGKQGRHGVDPKVSIGKMSPYRLSGVSLERVQLQLGSTDPDPGPTVDIDELNVRVGLFSLLFNAPTISFDVELYEGTIAGEVELKGLSKGKGDKVEDAFLGHTFAVLGGQVGGASVVDVEVEGIDLGRAPPVVEKVGVPVTGKLGGVVQLELGETPTKDAKGEIDLAIKGVTLGPGELKIPLPGLTGGLTLPLIDSGDLVAKAEVKEGKGTFEKLGLTGSDFSADIEGDLRIARKVDSSRLNASGWFKISEQFLEKNGKFKTIIDLASPLKRARDDDGRYHFDLRGSVKKPRFNLSKTGGKSKRRSRRATARKPEPPKPEAKEEAKDKEEE
jgi:type II secretion system protein N